MDSRAYRHCVRFWRVHDCFCNRTPHSNFTDLVRAYSSPLPGTLGVPQTSRGHDRARNGSVLLGFGELTLLLSGGWTLFASLAQVALGSPLGFLAGNRGLRAARYLFAVSIVPIGLSHLVYLPVTAGYVPQWLPFRKGWAILTGVGQIASGLGILFGVLPRVAAYAEAAQIMIYTFLVWGAAFLAAHTRLNITAFFISWILGSAAWAVAQNVPARAAQGPGAAAS